MRNPADAIRTYLTGQVLIPIIALQSAGFCTLVLVSAPAEAESFFSRFEYHSFWSDILPIILMVVLAIFVARWLRKKIRQQAASAPAEARRSPQERRLHYLSLVCIVAPVIYAFFLDVDLLFPVFAMLAAQAVLLAALRPLGLPFRRRLACILPAGLLSLIPGELVASWPALTLLPTAHNASALIACSASLALGAVLSYLSCPPAYRARAW